MDNVQWYIFRESSHITCDYYIYMSILHGAQNVFAADISHVLHISAGIPISIVYGVCVEDILNDVLRIYGISLRYTSNWKLLRNKQVESKTMLWSLSNKGTY